MDSFHWTDHWFTIIHSGFVIIDNAFIIHLINSVVQVYTIKIIFIVMFSIRICSGLFIPYTYMYMCYIDINITN